MLRLENVTKIYRNHKRETVVLKGISIEILKGDMIGIMGPSGSGKSTLLHIIGCLDYPTEGQYYIEGQNQSDLNDSQLAHMRNKKFGFVMQDFALLEDESVMDNIMVPYLFSKKEKRRIEKELDGILKKLNIEHLIEKKVKWLSGGEKQRVAIARALLNHPDIILADEPTGSLDSENTRNIMELLKILNESGIAVVIITHDIEVAKCCKTIYYMKDGQLALS